jgi:hypothetical protein
MRRFSSPLAKLPTPRYVAFGGLFVFAVDTGVFLAKGNGVGVAVGTGVLAGLGGMAGLALRRSPTWSNRREQSNDVDSGSGIPPKTEKRSAR